MYTTSTVLTKYYAQVVTKYSTEETVRRRDQQMLVDMSCWATAAAPSVDFLLWKKEVQEVKSKERGERNEQNSRVKVPSSAVPGHGAGASRGRTWHLWAAQHSHEAHHSDRATPTATSGAELLAARKVADSTAFG